MEAAGIDPRKIPVDLADYSSGCISRRGNNPLPRHCPSLLRRRRPLAARRAWHGRRRGRAPARPRRIGSKRARRRAPRIPRRRLPRDEVRPRLVRGLPQSRRGRRSRSPVATTFFARERDFEGVQAVLLGEDVVPPVHGAVGEVVIRRAHVDDVFAVPHRHLELQCQRFRAFELLGHDEHLARAGKRAADERVVPETARVLEVLPEQLDSHAIRLPRSNSGPSPARRGLPPTPYSSPSVARARLPARVG